jgi:hypothetical protein
MTAHERKDEAYYKRSTEFATLLIEKQAQEIKNRNMDIDALRTFNNDLETEIEALKKELALQKLSDIGQEIENEPVAWMLLGLEDRKPKLINPQVIDRLEGTWIPLYTHANEDRDSAIYATGYWKGIEKAKEKNETLDTRSYLIGRYDGFRELTDEEILELSNTMPYADRFEFARAILKKARNK